MLPKREYSEMVSSLGHQGALSLDVINVVMVSLQRLG